MNKYLACGLVLASVTTTASAIQPVGSVSSTTPITVQTGALATPAKKEVFLMKLKMTAAQKEMINSYKIPGARLAKAAADLPSKAEVSMGKVPVLDQGRHGTCVTFANAAAMDAVLNKADYVSELCNLELGAYLGDRSYLPSGWEGSWGYIVLNQMIGFGVISKENQRKRLCAGVAEYPAQNEYDTGKPMSFEDYKKISTNLSDKFYFEQFLGINDRFVKGTGNTYDANATLQKLKKVLTAEANKEENTRVTFGVILPYTHCETGACGKFHNSNDTWVLAGEILDEPGELGGHEMVIVGYDDNAVAVDRAGVKHTGLLTLRNSWGANVGDHGNYYMSYDFFKKYALEVQRLGESPEETPF